MKTLFKWLFIIIAIGGVSSAILLLLLPTPTTNAKYVPLLKKTINESLEVSGSVSSNQTYTLRASIAGKVSRLTLALGSTLIKGSMLAIIKPDSPPLIIESDSQEEAVLNNLIDNTDLAITQAYNEYQRVSAGVNAGVLPRFKLDEISASLSRANAQKHSATRRLNGFKKDRRTKKNNNRTIQKPQVITALSNGIVVEKSALNGQQVLAGTPILSIVSTDELSIIAMMQPGEARALTLGQAVQVSQPNTKRAWIERVVNLSPFLETEGRNKGLQKVTLSLSNRDHSITINENILLKIGTETKQQSLSLPIQAIVRKGQGYQAYVINKNRPLGLVQIYNKQGIFEALKHIKCNLSNCRSNSFSIRPQAITLGKSDINNIQILSPLDADLIVVIPDVTPDQNTVINLSLK